MKYINELQLFHRCSMRGRQPSSSSARNIEVHLFHWQIEWRVCHMVPGHKHICCLATRVCSATIHVFSIIVCTISGQHAGVFRTLGCALYWSHAAGRQE